MLGDPSHAAGPPDPAAPPVLANPPWVALPDQRMPTCLLAESIPSLPISTSTLLVPQLLPGLGSACLLLQGCDSSQAVHQSQMVLDRYGSLHYFNIKNMFN